MDNKLIITMILAIITNGILVPFTKPIADKLWAPYNPDTKKIISGIKKILLFSIRYVLLIIVTINLIIRTESVSKLFVVQICLSFSLLIISIMFDVMNKLFGSASTRLAKDTDILNAHHNLLELNANTSGKIVDTVSNMNEANSLRSELNDEKLKRKEDKWE